MQDTQGLITVELDLPALGDVDVHLHLSIAKAILRKYRVPSHLNHPIDVLFQQYLCAIFVLDYMNRQKTSLLPRMHPRTSIRNRLPYVTSENLHQLKSELQSVYDRFGIANHHQRSLVNHYQFCMMWKMQMCYANHLARLETTLN